MLEEEIKKLREEIEKLNKNFKSPAKETTKLKPVKEIKKEKVTPASLSVTPDDIQSLCARIVRTNRDRKKDIMSILESYDAKTISQVPTDKLEEVKSKLEEL